MANLTASELELPVELMVPVLFDYPSRLTLTPPHISRTLPALEAGRITRGDLIDINVLEYIVVIIDYALCLLHLPPPSASTNPYPTVLNHVDNIAAKTCLVAGDRKANDRKTGSQL